MNTQFIDEIIEIERRLYALFESRLNEAYEHLYQEQQEYKQRLKDDMVDKIDKFMELRTHRELAKMTAKQILINATEV